MNLRIAATFCLMLGALEMGCSLRKDAVVSIGDAAVGGDAKLDVLASQVGDAGGAGGAGGGAGRAGGGAGGSGAGGLAPAVDGGVTGDAPNVASGRDLGLACTNNSECASNYCVDGVCCNSACAGSCSACNVKDFVGQCAPVPGGTAAPAPHPVCPKMAAMTCKQNGLCDGKGACQLYPSGEACAGGACNAVTQTSVTGSMCDGLGACKAAEGIACSPFKCKADGTGCASACTTDTDCQGQPCVGGSCGKVANGSRCTAAVQCTSGNCVDGYCCDTGCSGSCQACDLAGTIGKCTTVPANQPPRNGRTACAAGTCGSRCDGTSPACVFAPASTSCGVAGCAAGMATAAVTCNGMGSCPVAAVTSCGGYTCAGASCRTTCATDLECVAPTPYCSAGKCQATKPLGRACTAGGECAGGNCVNGVCCSTASCGTCQACNLNGAGTCSNKPSTATDAACTATNCFTGTCNGAGACTRAADGATCGTNRFCRTGVCGACTTGQSCQPTNPCKTGTTSCTTGVMACVESGNKPANTLCGPAASCTGSTKTNAAMCNATGTCGAATPTQNCPGGCNSAGTDCLTCAGGQTGCGGVCCGGATPVCSAGTCVQCSSDAACSGSTPSCDLAAHACVCRRPNPGNLLPNPGFDTGPGAWDVNPNFGTFWKLEDADGCAGSGSLYGGPQSQSVRQTVLIRCIPITGGQDYSVGVKYKYGSSPDALVGCNVDSHADPTCQSLGSEQFGPSLATPRSTVWQSATLRWRAPNDVIRATIECFLYDAWIDQAYLNVSPTF